MDEDIRSEFEEISRLIRELGQRFRKAKDETQHLSSLVTAMEQDHKKAQRLTNEFEKMSRDRERMKEKIAGVMEKLDRLNIS